MTQGVNTIAHAGQHSEALYSSNQNPSEIISAYGVIALDDPFLSFGNDMSLIWANEKGDGAHILVDYEQNGLEDYLLLTGTNLWYIDDAFTNSEPFFTGDLETNPCIDATIKVNETIEISFSVDDVNDDDTVQARAAVYYNEANEQLSAWSADATAGTTFTFNFVLSETTSSSVLRLYGRDSGSNTTITSDHSFTVGINGVGFGQCTSSISLDDDEAAQDDDDALARLPQDNNAIESAIDELIEPIGIGRLAFWLIIMVVVGIAIWYFGHEAGQQTMTIAGIFLIIEGFLFILGVTLGFIGTGTLLVVVILGIIAISMMFRRWTTGV